MLITWVPEGWSKEGCVCQALYGHRVVTISAPRSCQSEQTGQPPARAICVGAVRQGNPMVLCREDPGGKHFRTSKSYLTDWMSLFCFLLLFLLARSREPQAVSSAVFLQALGSERGDTSSARASPPVKEDRTASPERFCCKGKLPGTVVPLRTTLHIPIF